MAYYYLTSGYLLYKSVGARKVKKIYKFSGTSLGLWEQSIKNIAIQIREDIDKEILNHFLLTPKPLPLIPIITTCTPSVPRRLKAGWIIEVKKDVNDFPNIFFKDHGKLRNVIPIQIFKSRHKIACESKNFYDIIFHLSSNKL